MKSYTPFIETNDAYEVCRACDTNEHIKNAMQDIEDIRAYNAKRQGLEAYTKKKVIHVLCPPHQDQDHTKQAQDKIKLYRSKPLHFTTDEYWNNPYDPNEEWERAAIYMHQSDNEK